MGSSQKRVSVKYVVDTPKVMLVRYSKMQHIMPLWKNSAGYLLCEVCSYAVFIDNEWICEDGSPEPLCEPYSVKFEKGISIKIPSTEVFVIMRQVYDEEIPIEGFPTASEAEKEVDRLQRLNPNYPRNWYPVYSIKPLVIVNKQ